MPVYRDLPWSATAAELGQFDLIIGSDILYERGHSAVLAVLLDKLALARWEFVISDPGRGNSGRMTHALLAQGYLASEDRQAFALDEMPPFAAGYSVSPVARSATKLCQFCQPPLMKKTHPFDFTAFCGIGESIAR